MNLKANKMTPQEKAKELFQNYLNLTLNVEYDNDANIYTAKQCALIAVEEILNTLYSIPFGNALDNELEYWNEVKQEIEKL